MFLGFRSAESDRSKPEIPNEESGTIERLNHNCGNLFVSIYYTENHF